MIFGLLRVREADLGRMTLAGKPFSRPLAGLPPARAARN